MNRIITIVLGLLILALIASSTMFVVDQKHFAAVYSFGEIREVITEPGLKFKLPPPVQNVVLLDRRVQTLESPDSRPIFTAEKKSLVIDWLAKWRIADARQFIRNSGASVDTVANRLSPVVQAAFNDEVTKRTVLAVLATERDTVMIDVRKRLEEEAKAFGIEIVDVRIKRVDFSANIAESVYKRMSAERQRVANEARATGGAEGEKIRADADRQAQVIKADAYRDAQKLRGAGDARASAIYADAFGRDPAFAKFYRALDAYRDAWQNKGDVMVLDPAQSEFFKTMRAPSDVTGGGAAPAHK
ncbi:MAG: protease modulator HflC [Pelomonas sp.]|nr:protease modulator HflC [Roseateles sp.]